MVKIIEWVYCTWFLIYYYISSLHIHIIWSAIKISEPNRGVLKFLLSFLSLLILLPFIFGFAMYMIAKDTYDFIRKK